MITGVNMDGENPEPEQGATVAVAENVESQQEVISENAQIETQAEMVPISAVRKERKKRQQVQAELEELRRKQPQQEDTKKYETATHEDLEKNKFESQRDLREEIWAESFPDRANFVKDELEEFLQQRPNLAVAIAGSTNRLKDAWELMNALGSKKPVRQESNLKKEAPRAPGTVPKAAGLNETVDLMKMSDAEFRQWRQAQRRRG